MADTTSGTTSGAASETTSGPRARGLRGLRYGEVLLVRAEGERLTATVYNTFPLNDCPASLWDALDTAAIAAEHHALVAVLNGPRHWLMDFIVPGYDGEPELETFGGLQMFRRASVDVTDRGLAGGPYTAVQVDRRALFGFDAGSTVFELIGPDGIPYVMQAWSRQVAADLDEPALHTLGSRLALPHGWSYRSRTLEAELVIDTMQTHATVVQDELQNTYSKTAP